MDQEPAPSKTLISMRIGTSGLSKIDQIAYDLRVPRAQVIRTALALSLRNEKELRAQLEALG